MDNDKRILRIPVNDGLFIHLVVEKADDDTWTCVMNTETLDDIQSILEKYSELKR